MNWTVSNEAKIGIFSFLKINMYKDLKENAETILKNTNVRLLLGEQPVDNGGGSQKLEEKDQNPLIQLYNVIDADSSQIDAIEMAKIGKSFVLQGPPGTGKSQTITNIVAELLANGKKVLFVSEKLAALNVVYDKFKKAGLDEFCLALHSHKANKKTVIEDLCNTLRTPPKALAKNRVNNDINSKAAAQEKLDKYAYAIHNKEERLDRSFYQLFEEYSSYRNAPDVTWAANDIHNKDYDYLNEASDLIKQFVEYVPSIGDDYKKNCWYGFTCTDTSYKTAAEIEQAVIELKKYLKNVLPTIIDINDYYKCSCKSIDDARNCADLFELLGNAEYLSNKVFNADNIDFVVDIFDGLAVLGKRINKNVTELYKEYSDQIIKIKAEQYYYLLPNYTSFFTRLFNSEYKQIVNEIRSCRIDGKRVSYDEAIDVTEKVQQLHSDTEEFNKAEAIILEYCNENYKGLNSDWDKLCQEIHGIRDILSKGFELGRIGNFELDVLNQEKDNFKVMQKN